MSKPALTWNLHLPDMSVDRKKGAGLKKRKICSVLIAGILSVGMILTGCGAGQPGGQSQKKVTEAEKKLKVVTTIFPQYDFVRQIAAITQTRADTITVTIIYGVTVKWTLPSFRKLTDFQSVVRIVFRFSSITTARKSRSSEPAEKRKTSDLSLALIRFPRLLNCGI